MLDYMFVKQLYRRIFTPDALQRTSYNAFKDLLDWDQKCHEALADLQNLYYSTQPVDWVVVQKRYVPLRHAVYNMIEALGRLSCTSETEVHFYFKKIDNYIQSLLTQQKCSPKSSIIWLDEKIPPQHGGNKAAHLSEVKQLGFNVPLGFVVTTKGWHDLIEFNQLGETIERLVGEIDVADEKSMHEISAELIDRIRDAKIPPELEDEIDKSIAHMQAKSVMGEDGLYAVRSSAVAEDGPNSFAGQYESVLNVSHNTILEKYLEVLSSKYSVEAIFYRVVTGISDADSPMAVLIMQMVAPEVAGVLYTNDPTGQVENVACLHATTGLAEKLVAGEVVSESCYIDKATRQCSIQAPKSTLRVVDHTKLIDVALVLEEYFGAPQDVEWAQQGDTLWFLQSRVLKGIPPHEEAKRAIEIEDKTRTLDLVELYQGGMTATAGRAVGTIFFFRSGMQWHDIPEGSILVVDDLPVMLAPLIPRLNGIIAREGSVACHFATVCREFQIPLVVMAGKISDSVTENTLVTVDADTCTLYQGGDFFPEKASDAAASLQKPEKSFPYYKKLNVILSFIEPLSLLDVKASNFTPGSCRSLHDIIRYTHEQGVQTMFHVGKHGSRRSKREKLVTDLPFDLYAINVGESQKGGRKERGEKLVKAIDSVPFNALWRGINHSSIEWSDHEYYNWKDYDNAALTDGFAFKDDSASASYVVYSRDYFNLNLKFGYHFTLIDCFCGSNHAQNYLSMRFSGGGGTFEGRFYRIQYIETILTKIGFQVHSKNDLLDAQLSGVSQQKIEKALTTLGRMLGNTKLMDMVFRDENIVLSHLDQFFKEEMEEV